ncbi:MAG: biopolymer transporter ExbD [Candidatus Sericytochromatia bacterium]
MKVKLKRKKRERVVFEIIPLIDVMMVLCLFFAIAAFLPRVQSAIDTKLPKSTTGEQAKEALVVSINSSGTIYVKDKVVSKNELLNELKTQLKNDNTIPLVLAADNNLKYDSVVSVLDTMKQTGASQIGIATDKEN